jgi:hypothetical protein
MVNREDRCWLFTAPREHQLWPLGPTLANIFTPWKTQLPKISDDLQNSFQRNLATCVDKMCGAFHIILRLVCSFLGDKKSSNRGIAKKKLISEGNSIYHVWEIRELYIYIWCIHVIIIVLYIYIDNNIKIKYPCNISYSNISMYIFIILIFVYIYIHDFPLFRVRSTMWATEGTSMGSTVASWVAMP